MRHCCTNGLYKVPLYPGRGMCFKFSSFPQMQQEFRLKWRAISQDVISYRDAVW